MYWLVVEPEHRPELRKIDDSLTVMQNIVGGVIQPMYLDDSVVLVCHEEGTRHLHPGCPQPSIDLLPWPETAPRVHDAL